jgi:hypothetical protein
MKYEKIHPTVTGDRSELAAKACATNDRKTSMSPIIAKNAQAISTLVENETRRLEKLAQLQQKELMRLLDFEAKSKELVVCQLHPMDMEEHLLMSTYTCLPTYHF